MHFSATFVATHFWTSRSHFSIIQYTQKGCHRTASAKLIPFSGLLDCQVFLQVESIYLPYGHQDGKPTMSVELEVSLHQLRKDTLWIIKRDLYALYPARIVKCRDGRGDLTESKNFLSFVFFFCKKWLLCPDFLIPNLYQRCINMCKISCYFDTPFLVR